MTRKLHYIISVFAALSLMASMVSCSDDDTDYTIYVPNAKTPQKLNFYVDEEPFVNTFTVKLTPRTYPDLNPAVISSDAKIYVEADPAKVEEYNQLKGTDYPVLPSEAYTVESFGIIKAGESESTPISITVDAKDNLKLFTDYMLAVSITGSEGVAQDDCCQTAYFIYRAAMDASGATLLDRSGWTVLAASSEEPREGDWGHSGLKEACIDGDLNTFWGTDWSTTHPMPPHWITFDLGHETDIMGFAIQAREEGYDGPKEMVFEISADGQSWTPAGEFKDIPARGEYRSFLPEAVATRYVKLTINAVNGGPQVTVSEFNLF